MVADPAWTFEDAIGSRGAASKYDCQSLDLIKAYPLPPLADDCVLFLWRMETMLQEALDVVRDWGFDPRKGGMIWRKLTITGKEHFGLGRIVRGAHEGCIIGTRGRPKINRKNQRSLFSAPVPSRNGRPIHSAKPDEFFRIVSSMYDGPRVSLFERTRRDGFDCFGDEMT